MSFRKWLVVTMAWLACGAASVLATTPQPRDRPYPGTITLNVDATDSAHRVYSVHETLPVQAGELTLFFPKWLPGHHSPGGAIEALTGLHVMANGEPVVWTRDTLDMYAFHLAVPQGARTLEIGFTFLAPITGKPTVRPEMLELHWNEVVLYPAGYYDRDIPVAADLTLPEGWSFATSLEQADRQTSAASGSQHVSFKTTSLESLIDSPVLAGRYFKRIDLDPSGHRPMYLDAVADAPDELAITDEQIQLHRRLVQESYRLYGSQHFAHYDFLLAISQEFITGGVEHHRSSANGVYPGYFKDWSKQDPMHALLAHEFTHSWNGKFRRPADLWTPNTNVPMQDSLLWVYEGMTDYWGEVLAARAGLRSPEAARQGLANIAAGADQLRPGRTWRNLQDTTNAPIIDLNVDSSWSTWERSADYYEEGALIWLDADTKIRELTGGKRSLDDFARAFLGVNDGREQPLTYTFADVVKGLNAIAPSNWSEFLRSRLDSHGPRAPLEGLTRSGWRIVYREKPTSYLEQAQNIRHTTDLSFSLGLIVDKEAHLSSVVWDGPAFNAGAAPGQLLQAVNGKAFTPERLQQAITDAHLTGKPIELLVRSLDTFVTLKVSYTGGLRYPDLERIEGTPDRLSDILRSTQAVSP